jgi:hypothetical protein
MDGVLLWGRTTVVGFQKLRAGVGKMEPAILRSPFPAFQRESKAQYYPLSRWCRSLDEGDPAGSATSASATAKRSTIRLSVAV